MSRAQKTLRTIFRNVLSEVVTDRVLLIAAGITFYFLLAMFPALACIVSVYGLFGSKATILSEFNHVAGFLPGGTAMILKHELRHLLGQKQTLDWGFAAGFAVAVWSASGGAAALVEGLNIAYEIPETRGFIRYMFDALLFTVAAIVAIALMIGFFSIVPSFFASLPHHAFVHAASRVLAWPISFALCVGVTSVIYHFGANREMTRWRWATWGGAVASALWIGGTMLFAWYVGHVAHYSRLYGDLGATVGFLTWVWISLAVLLLGAEINSEIERDASG